MPRGCRGGGKCFRFSWRTADWYRSEWGIFDFILPVLFTFVNNIHTPDGGTHMAGFSMALTRVINDYGRKHNILKANDSNLSG